MNEKLNGSVPSFEEFATTVYPFLDVQRFHATYYRLLQAFAEGKVRRLIITMPPQHGKSVGATTLLPAYMLGLNPDLRIAIASYSASLASRFNRRVQRILESQEYGSIFPDTTIKRGAYCAAHEQELSGIAMVINLDMIGSIMGHFIACVTAETKLVHYVSYMGAELGTSIRAYQDVYSSDSTPFADKGIPAISFARIAAKELAPIHNRYDTLDVMKAEQMLSDIDFITVFSDRMTNAALCPVAREIPDNVKEKLDEYLLRKRPKS